jgi:T5orf172 domain
MISDDLQKILDDDDGLLDSPQKPVAQSSDDRLTNSFLEINDFYEKNGRPPSSITDDITERRLSSRLDGIRSDPYKISILKEYDSRNLLTPLENPKSVKDILNDDELNLLDDDTGILTIKNVPKLINIPEYVGRQRRCEDFDKFEPLFIKCHEELRIGKRKIVDFRHQKEIVKGNYFVLRGVLVYVDIVGEMTVSANGLEDARLRLIYENGTESDILLLSFAKALFLDGRLVTENEDRLLDNFKGIDDEDQDSGYIYVLSTLSEKPELKNMQNLYKIGFSSRTVEERIKGAEQDPTYLMAPVKIVATYKCFNMSTQKFEHLLHRVFSRARLNLEVVGLANEKFVPDEWFVVPIDVIDQAVSLIISDEIVNYEYDDMNHKLHPRISDNA